MENGRSALGLIWRPSVQGRCQDAGRFENRKSGGRLREVGWGDGSVGVGAKDEC